MTLLPRMNVLTKVNYLYLPQVPGVLEFEVIGEVSWVDKFIFGFTK